MIISFNYNNIILLLIYLFIPLVSTGRLPSMLVYEVEEGTQRRHIVALNTFHATKLRKQLPSYTKLHIYNDHTFTATHIKG